MKIKWNIECQREGILDIPDVHFEGLSEDGVKNLLREFVREKFTETVVCYFEEVKEERFAQ